MTWAPPNRRNLDMVFQRYTLFPMDLDRTYRKLGQLKPHVAAWWKSGDKSMQVLRGGDAVASMVYSSRSVPLAKSGEFEFTWNQAIRDVGNWAILKGGPNIQNALRFLEFFVKNPQQHAAFSEAAALEHVPFALAHCTCSSLCFCEHYFRSSESA